VTRLHAAADSGFEVDDFSRPGRLRVFALADEKGLHAVADDSHRLLAVARNRKSQHLKMIRWYADQADGTKLAETLAESERKFLDGLNPKR
jgi:hypothetical protein